MSKNLKEIVKKIQFLKDWTVEEVAQSIGYSRVHLSKEMKRGENDLLRNLLLETHKEILQNVSLNEVHDTDASLQYVKKARQISIDKLSGLIIRTYALQQVNLSVLSELLADKNGASVTATQSELLKAVEAEEVKMRDALQA